MSNFNVGNMDLGNTGNDDHDFLFYLSQVIGWIYFFAWSFSFYGQVIENYRRKSVKGLSFDFEAYNLLGFTGYTIYTIWGYIDPKIGTGKVSIQDIVFAAHAVLITIFTIIQIFIYYDEKDADQKVSSTCKLIIICLIWGVLQIIFIERVLGLYDPHNPYNFNSVIYLGWCKVFISFIKYMPQAYFNYKRKSTEGWSIYNILLDFTGGTFSFAQNIIDTIRGQKIIIDDPTQSHALNIAKYALSIISIVFDILFITQHYCLYRHNNSNSGDNDNSNDDKKFSVINSVDISKGKYDYKKLNA
jgi:cystinosin